MVLSEMQKKWFVDNVYEATADDYYDLDGWWEIKSVPADKDSGMFPFGLFVDGEEYDRVSEYVVNEIKEV